MIAYIIANADVDSFVKLITPTEVVMTQNFLAAMAFEQECVAKAHWRQLPLHHRFHVHGIGVPDDHIVIRSLPPLISRPVTTNGPYRDTPVDEVDGF